MTNLFTFFVMKNTKNMFFFLISGQNNGMLQAYQYMFDKDEKSPIEGECTKTTDITPDHPATNNGRDKNPVASHLPNNVKFTFNFQ